LSFEMAFSIGLIGRQAEQSRPRRRDHHAHGGTLVARQIGDDDDVAWLESLARAEPCANRLRTVPGIVALNATAIAAAVDDISTFAKGRDFAAWLGLVSRQITSGRRPRLVGITKRGSTYMRVLLIHGVRSATPGLAKGNRALGAWLKALLERTKRNVVVVALANKLARLSWAVLTTGAPFKAVPMPPA
jgi:transposase